MIEFKEVEIKTKVFKTTSTNKLREADLADYYRGNDYVVFFNYKRFLTEFNVASTSSNPLHKNGVKSIKTETLKLFLEHDNGYPDLLLVKDGEISFVEIKINKDALATNQYSFIRALMEFEDVAVSWFYNENGVVKQAPKEVKRVKNPHRSLLDNYIDDLRQLVKIRKIKEHKDYWVLRNIIAKYGELVSSPEYTKATSKLIGLSEKSILWYYDNNFKKILIETSKKETKFKAELDNRKEERLLNEIERSKGFERKKLAKQKAKRDEYRNRKKKENTNPMPYIKTVEERRPRRRSEIIKTRNELNN